MIGDRINELRRKNILSQEELANKLCVSSRTIIKWENNETEPSSSNLSALADLFGVSSDYLLGRENNSKRSDRKYCVISIIMFCIFIVFAVGLIVGLVFSTRSLGNLVNYISSDYAQGPVGLHFASSELVDKTIAFAQSQGAAITKDSDTFVQWQSALLGAYHFINGEYWFGGFDYRLIIWYSILEIILIYSLSVTVYLFIQNLRNKLLGNKVLDIMLAFTSLDLPIGFILLALTLISSKKQNSL